MINKYLKFWLEDKVILMSAIYIERTMTLRWLMHINPSSYISVATYAHIPTGTTLKTVEETKGV